ncbi:MAG TPA: thioredoxin [Gammaproteobacteria bacterium]|nr:thioredoxin [Gammaproteobacteria bacterium]
MRNGCKWLRVVAAVLVIGAGPSRQVDASELMPATDLQREGRAASTDCVPLLLEFARGDCEYCTLLEQEVLEPMQRNRDYRRRVRMRRLLLDSDRPVRDFDGRNRDAESLARRYQVRVTPTLLFVDDRGQELADRMVGVTTLDFYGAYLDQALEQARDRLRHEGCCPHRP